MLPLTRLTSTACYRYVALRPPNGDVHGAMALLWRDTTCSFLEKTERAQQIGSTAAIHVNTQNELMQVEAKNAGTYAPCCMFESSSSVLFLYLHQPTHLAFVDIGLFDQSQ